MGRIKTVFSKIFVRLYLFLRVICAKRSGIQNGEILVVLLGKIGDGLLNSSALLSITREYVSRGKKVYLLCSRPAWKVLKMIPGTEEITYVNGYLSDTLTLKTVREAEKNLNREGYESIFMMTQRGDLSPLIYAGIPANKTYLMYTPARYGLSWLYYLFVRHFTDVMPISWNGSTYEQCEKLLAAAGISGYKASVSYIPKQLDYPLPSKHYVTLALDSTRSERRWPSGCFIELTRRLLEKYSYDVILTGSEVTDPEISAICSAFKSNDRVKVLVGKTNLNEWVELIRGSKFHIGVDGGSIHVAASVGTQAFCLSGVWDSYRIMPYHISKNTPGTKVPVCIYRSDCDLAALPCFDCNGHRFFGYKNPTCAANCQTGLPCQCLDKITVDEVMNTIEETLKGGESVNDIP